MNSLAQLTATIPPPPFQNLELGPLTLHGYGLTMGIAIISALALAEWGLKRQHVDTSRFTALALISLAGGFIGARLYHVLSEPTRFADSPEDIIKIWQGGLGIYGAMLGGAIAGLLAAPRLGVPRRALCDAAAPAFLLAQAIGRFGNYLNQELYGRPFDGAWALEVEVTRRPAQYLDVATYHPTFLYESVANFALAGLFVLLLVRWEHRPPGILFPLYIAAYSVVRILVEPLRIDDAHEWLGVRQNVWVAGGVIVLGLAIAYAMYRAHRTHMPPRISHEEHRHVASDD